MNHYTYLIQYTDGKLYHGVRSCACNIEDDKYQGSGCYTPKDSVVNKIILTTHNTRKEALAEEVWYHKEYDVKSHPDYYNKANQTTTKFDFDSTGYKHSEEALQKMSDLKKGKTTWAKGTIFSDEHRANISKSRIGNKWAKGHKLSDEAKAKIGNATRDDNKYWFKHSLYGLVCCTRRYLKDNFNKPKYIDHLFRKNPNNSHKGWVLYPLEEL